MSTITLRSVKGSALSFTEVDNNFTNLNTDKLEGVTSSVDGELTLWSSTTGKVLKRATITGLVKATAGVATTATAGTDYVSPTGSETLTNKTLTNPSVNNYTEGVVSIGTVTSSNTIALTNGTVQTATLTASTACTFTMPTATAGKSFILLLKQAATTGNGTATFTGVKFGTAGAPTIGTSLLNNISIVSLGNRISESMNRM